MFVYMQNVAVVAGSVAGSRNIHSQVQKLSRGEITRLAAAIDSYRELEKTLVQLSSLNSRRFEST